MDKDGLIYNPPAWRVCGTCAGTGHVYREVQSAPGSTLGGDTYNIVGKCPDCEKGRVPIRYTPEQWEEAGGVLSDGSLVWYRDKVNADGWWHVDTLGGAKYRNTTWFGGVYIIIAIPGQDRPDDNWRPE